MGKDIKYIRDTKDPAYTHYYAYHDDPESKPLAHLQVLQFPEQTFTHVNHTNALASNAPGAKSRHGDKSLGVAYQVKLKDHLESVDTRSPQERATNPDLPISESGLINISTAHETRRDYGLNVHNHHLMSNYVRPAEENEQLQLFIHKPASTRQVSELLARGNPAAQISAMTMLGMADIDARHHVGAPLEASNNLSKYSQNLVSKLENRGAISKSDQEVVSNNYNFDTSEEHLDDSPTLSQHKNVQDMTSMSRIARHHVRTLMHPKKADPANNNPEGWRQPTLWED